MLRCTIATPELPAIVEQLTVGSAGRSDVVAAVVADVDAAAVQMRMLTSRLTLMSVLLYSLVGFLWVQTIRTLSVCESYMFLFF